MEFQNLTPFQTHASLKVIKTAQVVDELSLPQIHKGPLSSVPNMLSLPFSGLGQHAESLTKCVFS